MEGSMPIKPTTFQSKFAAASHDFPIMSCLDCLIIMTMFIFHLVATLAGDSHNLASCKHVLTSFGIPDCSHSLDPPSTHKHVQK